MSLKKMTIEDVKSTIKNHILNSITQRDLVNLCNIFEIPPIGRKLQIQKRLIDSILMATNVELLHRILFMINRPLSNNNNNIVNNNVNVNNNNNVNVNYLHHHQQQQQVDYYQQDQSGNGFNSRKLYLITNEMMEKSPIDLRSELIAANIEPNLIFHPNHTKYPAGFFNAPSSGPSLINGRVNLPNIQLPYCARNSIIRSSEFYCSQVVLHPLSLLIPKPTPNMSQPNRVMCKQQLQFTVSSHARHLITTHRTQINNKRFYKWQILVRFGVYDPSKPFPGANNPSGDNIACLQEYIPPYLTIFVNNVSVPLWDILPSNSTAKEGKRHPRPINISDYLKFSSSNAVGDESGRHNPHNTSSSSSSGFRQSITVNWWQTPAVYQYYYFSVFLERKLAVDELLDRFVNKTHHVQMPIGFTINFIREKFSSNNNNNNNNNSNIDRCSNKNNNDEENDDDDDDLVMSSVLPVSLLCPVGKSRIECPLRGVLCQHLQCFDARLYLMMNERRSVWKCPVCDASATMGELFVDEFFRRILDECRDGVNEVNVNPDGSWSEVAVKEGRGERERRTSDEERVRGVVEEEEKGPSEKAEGSEPVLPVILIGESEDDASSDDSEKAVAVNVVSSKNSEMVSSNSTKPAQSHSNNATMTIDLTSDSEEDDKERNKQPLPLVLPSNQSSHAPINITNNHSNYSSSSSFIPSFPHANSHSNSSNNHNLSVIRTFVSPHQYIAPKLPLSNNAFLKIPDTHSVNRNINYYQSTSSSSATATVQPIAPVTSVSTAAGSASSAPAVSNTSVSHSNPFQSSAVINNPGTSSQPPPNKILPPYLWMHQPYPGSRHSAPHPQQHPHRLSGDIINCYMPPLKPCFPPNQSYSSMIPPAATAASSYHHNNNPFAVTSNLMPKPIKIDPHLNICHQFDKDIKKTVSITTTSSGSSGASYNFKSAINTTDHTTNQENKKHKSKAESKKKQTPSQNANARRSTRILNQHRKVYREKSLSEEEEDDDEDDDDDSPSSMESNDSDIICVGRNSQKRRNNFDDSSSSSSFGVNRKRKRLLFEASSSDEENNKNRKLVHHHQHQSSSSSDKLTNFDKYPLVLLNKLDPVLLKVYLQQNEVSSVINNDENSNIRHSRDSSVVIPHSSQQSASVPSSVGGVFRLNNDSIIVNEESIYTEGGQFSLISSDDNPGGFEI